MGSVVVPVRITAGTRIIQSTSRELIPGSVRLVCADPPASGEVVGLRIGLFPGIDLTSAGLVRRVPSEPSSFWADFMDMEAGGARRIAQLLQSLGPERRALSRQATRLPAIVGQDRSAPGSEHVTSLTSAGMFIETTRPLAEGDLVPVQVELPDGQPPLEAMVRVARVHVAEGGLPAGVGVQFASTTDEAKERIDALLRSLRGSWR